MISFLNWASVILLYSFAMFGAMCLGLLIRMWRKDRKARKLDLKRAIDEALEDEALEDEV